ncbi:hypothetical protein APUTEX25_005036 [Auxenochlorella protothecoides]|uniref:Uncharacterized protein n=1 Tax=Auxenochlorella protothecoides TaxID=3075 RepID=A0A3M7L4F2_AUXPR|nr:hypothetical protein APUTEX25_005036 [Auxenochlorella protothecoides]|eukprot:RMZ56974.1 hypothetical protein APUTEX25_005036 [Auxenochlorella protothecoides]
MAPHDEVVEGHAEGEIVPHNPLAGTMISIAITDPITIKVRAVLPCGTVRLRDAGHLAHCSCNSSVPSTGGTSGRQNDTYYNSGYQDQYHQGWQNGRGRGRGYFGGRGSQNPGYQQQQGYSSNRGGRGRGRGRSQPGQSQPAPEPLPDDVEFLAELKGHTGKVTVVAMDQGSGQLFTGSHDGTVRCVSTVDVGGEVDSLLLEAGFLFVGIKTPANQGQIKAWNMSTNQETVLEGHTGQVLSLAAAGGMLFSGAQDATIRVWKPSPLAGFECSAVLRADGGGHSSPVSCLCASGPYLFSADFKGNIKAREWHVGVWDVTAGVLRQAVDRAHSGAALAAITDLFVWQNCLFSGSLDGCIKVWEPCPDPSAVINAAPSFVFPDAAEGGAAARSPTGPRPRPGGPAPALPGILALAGLTDPAGRAVLMVSYNGEPVIRLWELPSFEGRGVLSGVKNVRAMTGYSAGNLLLSGDERGQVKIWRWRELPQANAGAF